MAKYVKAFNVWDSAINSLAYQGLIKVQSGQAAYCGDRSSPCVIDEINKGYIRAFHAPTMKEARKKYNDYKRVQKIAKQRKMIMSQIKELENDLLSLNNQL